MAWAGSRSLVHKRSAADFVSSGYEFSLSGSPFAYEDYEIGEKIDHVDAFTVEEAEHQIATRLYQNTAKVHFNQHAQAQTPRGKNADPDARVRAWLGTNAEAA